MFVVGNLIRAVAAVIDILLSAYTFILVGRAIVSWVGSDRHNPIVNFLHQATDPVLRPVRRLLPLRFGGVDFSPLVVLLAIAFLRIFLVDTLAGIAVRLH